MSAIAVPRRAWLALAAASLTVLMVVIDTTVINVAFPSIRDDLGISSTTLSWIVSVYTIVVASFLLLAGRLADRVGRRKVFRAAVVLFITGSTVCALADTFGVLIIGRAIQALGGAAVFPSSLALVLPEFPPERRSTAIGIWGSMAAAGGAIGPTLGALLTRGFGWPAIFWINVPVGVVVLVLSLWWLHESFGERQTSGRLDVVGVPLVTSGVALIMLGIVQAERWGFGDARVIAFIAVGLALVPVAVRRSRHHPNPMLDLSLFEIVSFRAAVVSVTLFGSAFLGGFLGNALLLQEVWGFSVLETGLGLTPAPTLAVLFSVTSGRFAERVGHRWLVAVGATLCSLSFLWLWAFVDTEAAYATAFLPANLVLGAGIGLSVANFTGAALSEVDPTRFAIANATSRTVQQMAYALGVALFITLLADRTDVLDNYGRAWLYLVVMYAASAAAVLVLFPRGSVQGRTTQAATLRQ